MIRKHITIYCDHPTCLNTYETLWTTVHQARREARRDGWAHVGGDDLCANHNPTTRVVEPSGEPTRTTSTNQTRRNSDA